MKSLSQIRQQIQLGHFNLTRHALKRVVERNISRQEIMEAGKNAIIVENYPDDKYAPSCLLLGFTDISRPLHIQVSYLALPEITIITIYEPSESKWINYLIRR